MNSWHALPQELEIYRSGAAEPVLADSIETHLIRCAQCRTALARTADPAAVAASARRWEELTSSIDAGTSTPLLRLGASTRPLVAALGAAALLLVVVPLLVAATAGPERMPTVLLAGAPLAPMLAVVFAYRREADPVGELSLAAPVAGIRLVARRALLVAAAGAPLGVAAALASGVPLSVALAWLLPGLALSGVVLAVGTTRLDPGAVAAVLGTAWALSVGLTARRGSADLVVDLVAGAMTQYGCLLVAVVSFALAVARKDRLVYRSSM